MSQLKKLIDSVGHASNAGISAESKSGWNERKSTSALILNEFQAHKIEAELNESIDKEAAIAAQSQLGQNLLKTYRDKYGILEGSKTEFPKYSDIDIITDGMCIMGQLYAEQVVYGNEKCNFTQEFLVEVDYFLNWDFENNVKFRSRWGGDPFENYDRPDKYIHECDGEEGMAEWMSHKILPT